MFGDGWIYLVMSSNSEMSEDFRWCFGMFGDIWLCPGISGDVCISLGCLDAWKSCRIIGDISGCLVIVGDVWI